MDVSNKGMYARLFWITCWVILACADGAVTSQESSHLSRDKRDAREPHVPEPGRLWHLSPHKKPDTEITNVSLKHGRYLDK